MVELINNYCDLYLMKLLLMSHAYHYFIFMMYFEFKRVF